MSIPDLAKLYRELGKRTFAICDKQCDVQKALIEAQVETLFMHKEKGFEELVLENTTDNAMNRFLKIVNHPQTPHPRAVLREYFYKKKGEGSIADFLAQCVEDEIPEWLRSTCISLKIICEASPENQTTQMQ